MPPIPHISKELVLQTAFTIARTERISLLNARCLAKQLNASTQPIFRVYENMDSLKQEVVQKAEAFYNSEMMKGLEHPIPFLGMGLAYVNFAKTERKSQRNRPGGSS